MPRARCPSYWYSTAARCLAHWRAPGWRTGSGPSRSSPRVSRSGRHRSRCSRSASRSPRCEVGVAIVGLGTSGTQTLIYGFVANYYRTNVRAAGVAWCAGFGRLGGVGGPLLGGFLIGGGFALNSIFYVLAGLGLLGVMLTLLVPIARRTLELHTMRIEPTPQAGPDKVAAAVAPTT